MSVRVSLANAGIHFSAPPSATLLEAALDAGFNLPHSCKTGHCLACRARLLSGEIAYPEGVPLALGEQERAAGELLLCRAQARSDLTLELLSPTLARAHRSRRLPCRIERAEEWGHDVRGLFLRMPAAAPLVFEAGQYIDILIERGRRRSFSIASPPHEPHLLEVHVRRVPGGELTGRLFEPGIEGRLLHVEGPLGQFVYRESDRPLLLIGGGTGLAPLKCIVRHVLERGSGRRALRLYWGVRSERDLYAHAWLEATARRAPAFDYRPVLSEPSATWSGRRGWVHDCVLAELGELAPYDIYASGPPAMIEAVQSAFPRHGADPQRLHFDSFDFAPDSVARQRMSASSSD